MDFYAIKSQDTKKIKGKILYLFIIIYVNILY